MEDREIVAFVLLVVAVAILGLFFWQMSSFRPADPPLMLERSEMPGN